MEATALVEVASGAANLMRLGSTTATADLLRIPAAAAGIVRDLAGLGIKIGCGGHHGLTGCPRAGY